MNIDPTLTTIDNFLQTITNPALQAPTDPNQLALTVPASYDPSSLGFFLGPGLNLDGSASNTQIIIYLRPAFEDVAQDGVNQVLIYERCPLAAMVSATPAVQVNTQMTATQLLQVVAQALGVVADAIAFVMPPPGEPDVQPSSVQVDAIDSPLYLPGPVTVALDWA